MLNQTWTCQTGSKKNLKRGRNLQFKNIECSLTQIYPSGKGKRAFQLKSSCSAPCTLPPRLPASAKHCALKYRRVLLISYRARAPQLLWNSTKENETRCSDHSKRIRGSQSLPVPQKQNSETTFKDAEGGRDKGACQYVKTCPSFSIFPFPDRQSERQTEEAVPDRKASLFWKVTLLLLWHFSWNPSISPCAPTWLPPPRAAYRVRRQLQKDFWKWPILVRWRPRWSTSKQIGLYYSTAEVWLSAKKHMTQQNRKRTGESPGARPML